MNKLAVLVLAILVLTLFSCIVTAAEIIVKPGDSIQDSINNTASGDTIIVRPGTYTENIKVIKDDLTIRSESGNPDDTIIKAKNSGDNALLLQADKVKINGFKISGSVRYGYSGIFLSSCSNCTIENNKLLSNSYGIYLLNSKDNTISKNTVSDSDKGIYFRISESNTLSRNKATGNEEYGIALQSCIGNVLSGNLVFNNERGVYFGLSDGNTIIGNTVRNNNVYGLFVCGGSDRNIIYNNSFNDTNMTIKNGTGNAYNKTKTAGTNIVSGPYIGGNYWAKPDGTGFSQTAIDKNGDGISDSVYVRIAGSKYSDFLPLVIIPGPEANFWESPNSGEAPLSVEFHDMSTGKPTEWNWDFGDGASSTAQSPVHTYAAAGNYTVTLTVSNANGTDSKTSEIIVKRISPTGSYAYIPNSGNGTVSVIDTATNTVTAVVNVGRNPWGVAVSSDGKAVYVTNVYSRNVSVIDTATNTVKATVNGFEEPWGVAISPDRKKVYVANSVIDKVSIIDTATNKVAATVTVGNNPRGVAVSPDGTKVFVTNQINNTTSVIDTATNAVTATVDVGRQPWGVAVSPDAKKVYVANYRSSTVSVINAATNTVSATVNVGRNPVGVALTPDGTKAYVTNYGSNNVSVIDTAINTVTTTVDVGNTPYGVAFTPDGTKAYVSNLESKDVSVIDTATSTVIAVVKVGRSAAFGQFIVPPLVQP